MSTVRQNTSRSDYVLLGLTALAVVPAVLVLGIAMRLDWVPTSDRAIELLRAHDVGTSHTPIVGPYSRFGWSHPGPLLFWFFAPALRLFGPHGVLALVAALNTGWFLGAVAAAQRLGGNALAGTLVVAGSVMIHSQGAANLADPWNPLLPVLPLLCFLFCAAAFAETGARWSLAMAIVAGSLAAQSHLGSAPIVAFGALGAAIWYRRARPRPAMGAKRWLVAAGATLLLWSAPLLEQLAHPSRGNLRAIVRFVLSGDEKPGSLWSGLGIAAREMGVVPSWAGASETRLLTGTDDIGRWTLLILPALLCALIGLARHRNPRLVRQSVFALGLLAGATLAVTRTVGVPYGYLLRWTWAVAVVVSVTAVAGLWSLAMERLPAGSPIACRASQLAVGIGFAVVLCYSGLTTWAAATSPLEPAPIADLSARETSEAIKASLAKGNYRVRWIDTRGLNAAPLGIATDLARSGYDLEFPPSEARTVGGFRAGEGPGLETLLIVGSSPRPSWDPPPGGRLIARWDPLSVGDRRLLEDLAARVRADAARRPGTALAADRAEQALALRRDGARPKDVAALGRLQARGEGYEAWLLPPGDTQSGPAE